MTPHDLIELGFLMNRTVGSPRIGIGLIDGPVRRGLPQLNSENMEELKTPGAYCSRPGSYACEHGTLVAALLMARREAEVPGICPGCRLLLRPIFSESASAAGLPAATPSELARALLDCIGAGARLINLSAAIVQPSATGYGALQEALDTSARNGVLVVAAAGNQGCVGSSVITQHPWVIPVTACNPGGRVMDLSNLSRSISRQGACAPGERITSIGSNGRPREFGGTSAATPFITGALALLWSLFPTAGASQLKLAFTRALAPRDRLMPPLFNARSLYGQLTAKTFTR